jgi:phospholipid/cholesterol/gamma-HCH transport system ATP-binding protein
VIYLQDVWASYGERPVLRGLSVNCEAQKITALVGPSGSGKSTILRVAMGLHNVDKGFVVVDGEHCEDYNERRWRDVRRKMGLVFQNSALFDSLTVLQNVGFHPFYVERYPWKKVRSMAMDMLEELGLDEAANKMPSQLSGGMQRRVALARSLVYHPKILMYDEPTTGLDPLNIDIVSDLIVETAERFGVTSLVVSHDLQAITRVADEVVIIANGTAHSIGPPEQLLLSDEPEVVEFTRSWREQIAHFAGAVHAPPPDQSAIMAE